jgi:IS1 family transposase
MCPNNECRHTLSIRQGSFFHDSRLSLYDQMNITMCFCEDMTLTACQKLTGHAKSTLVDYYDNLRGCYSDEIDNTPVKGTGLGPYEVDEVSIDHVEISPGSFDRVWILDMIERDTGKYRAFLVPNRSSETLSPRISEFAPPDSLIFTDDWAGYSRLGRLGYRHHTVNHSSGEYSRVVEIDGTAMSVHINTIEGLHKTLRQRLLNKSRRNCERMELILAECMYRRSGRPLFEPFKIKEK